MADDETKPEHRVTAYVDAATRHQIEALAAQLGGSESQAARLLIREALAARALAPTSSR